MRFRHPRLMMTAALVFCLTGVGPSRAAGTGDAFEGSWSGAILYEPDVNEVDFTLEVSRQGEGWEGVLRLPLASLRADLEGVVVDGSKVTFGFEDENGRRTFEGELSVDGDAIRGTYSRPDVRAPFELVRLAESAPVKIPEFLELQDIPGDGTALGEVFDGDRDRVRLLMLLSPTCVTCQISARIVQRHVVDVIPDDRLRVYVVWMPVFETDHRHDAESVMWTLSDPRVRHFWATGLGLSEALKASLGITEGPVWDVFLVYPSAATWQQPVPTPPFFMHHADELPKDSRFNGAGLAAEIRKLLATPGG